MKAKEILQIIWNPSSCPRLSPSIALATPSVTPGDWTQVRLCHSPVIRAINLLCQLTGDDRNAVFCYDLPAVRPAAEQSPATTCASRPPLLHTPAAGGRGFLTNLQRIREQCNWIVRKSYVTAANETDSSLRYQSASRTRSERSSNLLLVLHQELAAHRTA